MNFALRTLTIYKHPKIVLIECTRYKLCITSYEILKKISRIHPSRKIALILWSFKCKDGTHLHFSHFCFPLSHSVQWNTSSNTGGKKKSPHFHSISITFSNSWARLHFKQSGRSCDSCDYDYKTYRRHLAIYNISYTLTRTPFPGK